MSAPVQTLIVILCVLEIKHYICDFPLQTRYQFLNKGTYLHPGGILHSAVHALFTMSAFLIAPPTIVLGIVIVVGEFFVHYHIDWSKEQIIRRNGWVSSQKEFWGALGADQLLHHLTYLAIGALLVGAWQI